MPTPNPILAALTVAVSLLTAIDADADADTFIASGAFAGHKIILRDAREQSTHVYTLLHRFDRSSMAFSQTMGQIAGRFDVILPFAHDPRMPQTAAVPRSQASPKAVIEAISRFQSDPDFQSVSVLIDGYEQPLGLRVATSEETSVAERVLSYESKQKQVLTQIESYSTQDQTTGFVDD